MSRSHKGRSVQDVQGIFRSMTRACSAFDKKLTLEQDPSCTQPGTCLESGRIQVPVLSPYMTDDEVRVWRGTVTHEVGHHAPEVQGVKEFMAENGLTFCNPFGSVMNIFEDIRNELNPRIQQYPGFRDDLSWMQGFLALRGIRSMGSHRPEKDEDVQVLEALALAYKFRATKQPHVAYPSSLWEAEGWGVKYYHLLPRLETLATIEDVYELAKEFLPPNGDDDSGEQDKSEDSDNSEEGESEGGEGGDDSGDEERDVDADGDDSTDDSGDDPMDKPTDATISYEDLMGHRHSDSEGIIGDHSLTIKYDHQRHDDYEPWEDQLVMKARDLDGTTSTHEWGGCKGDATAKMRHVVAGEKLSSKARRLFQAQTQSRITHNHKSGRLDKRDLYRIPSGAKDVFKRKEDAISTDGIAVFLLGDASGSMSGREYDVMSASCTLLSESIAPLGIPHKIAVFTESAPKARHFVIKEWDERRNREDMIDDYCLAEGEMCQNADGESVMWAYRELMKRPEPRKLLIVMSDGQPSADARGDCWTYTKDVVEMVSKQVECYGIGIMSDAVSDFYPEYVVLDKVSELEECLLNVIKQKIFTN